MRDHGCGPSCTRGLRGTPRCNYGRFCGVLEARGEDVAEIMIGEGLAALCVRVNEMPEARKIGVPAGNLIRLASAMGSAKRRLL